MRSRFLRGAPCAAVAVLALSLVPFAARAQGYQVYEWATTPRHEIEPEFQSTYIAQSDVRLGAGDDTTSTRQGLWAHSAEVEYGITSRWALAVYADGDQRPADALRFVGARVETRFRLFANGNRVLNPTMYLEYAMPSGHAGERELEGKLLMERDLGAFRLDLNPAIARELGTEDGEDGDEHTKLEGAAGLYYRGITGLTPGLEYFPKFGPVGRPLAWREQSHLVFATMAFHAGDDLALRLGVGRGFTDASDRWTLKTAFEFELPY